MSMMFGVARATDSQIAALHAAPDGVLDFLFPEDRTGPPACDIDRSWHAIHYLLTGDPWDGEPPLDFIAAGGTPIGDVDVGYGPARALTSSEVQALAAALAPITVESLFARWDPAAIRAAELYSVDPDTREAQEEYIGDYFTQLKVFVAEAAREHLGLIMYLT